MPVERIRSAELPERVLQGTVGEVRRRGHRPDRVLHRGVSRSNPHVAERWSQALSLSAKIWAEGGGIIDTDREAVKNKLRASGFYDGLTGKNIRIFDLGVGAQSYLDAERIPQGATVIAADRSQAMLDALKASQEKDGVQLHTDFRVMDATSLDNTDGPNTRTLSTFMMRYLSEYEQKIAILGMIDAAGDNGRIDIIDYDTVDNYNRGGQQASRFIPEVVMYILESTFFEERLRELGVEVTVTMDEIPRPKQPFTTRMYHLRLDVSK